MGLHLDIAALSGLGDASHRPGSTLNHRSDFVPRPKETSSAMEEGLELDPRAPNTQLGLLTSCKLPRKRPVLQKFSFLKSTSRGLGDGSVGKSPALREDLSSDPQYPCKEWDTVVHACNARVRSKRVPKVTLVSQPC